MSGVLGGMSIRVMSSGRGYEYLLKSVAAGDGDHAAGTPLTRYYQESGTPPGMWLGSGLVALGTGRLPAGFSLARAHAEGTHALAMGGPDGSTSQAVVADAPARSVDGDPGVPGSSTGSKLRDGDRVEEEQLARLLGAGLHPLTAAPLGRAFPRLRPPRERIAARIARLDPELADDERARMVERIRLEEVARRGRTAVAGFDLTFSPPKSLSVLWAVADGRTQQLLAAAHHASLRDTIALLEERVASTRVGRGGVASMPVAGVIAAAFDHYDSRAGDPHLHTHVVVSNKVQGVDGVWRSLDSRVLHRATVALSASYTAFLADHTARMLGTKWVPVDRGRDRNTGWEIEGVPTELIAAFSQRTTGGADGDGIAAATERLIADYVAEHGRTPSPRVIARLRQQATLQTRPEKEHHSLSELTARWRERATRLLGTDATGWARDVLPGAAVDAALHATDVSEQQVADLATTVVVAVADRRATWSRWNLHAETMRQMMGWQFATTEDRTAVLGRVLSSAEAGSLRLTPAYDRAVPDWYRAEDGTNRFQTPDRIQYTSHAILDAEHRLTSLARRRDAPVVPGRLIAHHVDRPVLGVRLSADQAAAVRQIAGSALTLDLLVGPAGAGKTTTLRALRRTWMTAHGRDSVIGLAPSAAAADVLADSLKVPAENTAKFLYEHDHGRWDLRAGQLVIIDEATLAGTLTLDRITTHAAAVGAKVLLVGDPAQLSSIEAGGAFGMLTRQIGDVAELTDVHRITADWEKTTSLHLRHGDTTAIDTYQQHGRIHDGDLDTMIDTIHQAWTTNRAAGLTSLMIAADTATVTALNQRARTELVDAGAVTATGVALHDGTTAGVGDLIVTRRNHRHLSDGHTWVKNGDRWTITRHHDDGALTVRRADGDGQPHGNMVELPARYVAADVELGYATTIHRAQGTSVDTAHVLIDPDRASREQTYVAMTRGRTANHAYFIQPDPDTIEEHVEPPQSRSATEQFARVLARTDTALSATETLQREGDRHASLTTLLNEYDLLAHEAEADRVLSLIENAPLPESLRNGLLASPHYPKLAHALTRHRTAGHDPGRALAALVPALPAPDTSNEVAEALAERIDQATRRLPGPDARTRRIAGLIRTPAGPHTPDMATALTQRERLITAAARRLLHQAISEQQPWLRALGPIPAEPQARERWLTSAMTLALYRHRYEITTGDPVPKPMDNANERQTDEYRTAVHARRHATSAQQSPTSPQGGIWQDRHSARRF